MYHVRFTRICNRSLFPHIFCRRFRDYMVCIFWKNVCVFLTCLVDDDDMMMMVVVVVVDVMIVEVHRADAVAWECRQNQRPLMCSTSHASDSPSADVVNYLFFFSLSFRWVVSSPSCHHSVELCWLYFWVIKGRLHHRGSAENLDQVGRCELVQDDCALHHSFLNSITLELKFKPELVISSNQALNFAFYTCKQKQWWIVQILTCKFWNFWA